jgi:hypothetical protein
MSRELYVIERRPAERWVIEDHFIDRHTAQEQLEWLQQRYAEITWRLVRYVPEAPDSPSTTTEKP